VTIKVRLSGEPDEIDAMVAHLREAFDLAGGDRAYLEIRPRGDQPHVRSQRVHLHRKPVEP
jgi:hypothetical protein